MNIEESIINKTINHHRDNLQLQLNSSNANDSVFNIYYKTANCFRENYFLIKDMRDRNYDQFNEDIMNEAINKYREDNPESILVPHTELILCEIELNARLIFNIVMLYELIKNAKYKFAYDEIKWAVEEYKNNNPEKVINHTDPDIIIAIINIADSDQYKKRSEYLREVSSIVKENEYYKEIFCCVICKENDVSSAFIPCGHVACCSDCSPAMKRCPKCKSTIKGTCKTFLY